MPYLSSNEYLKAKLRGEAPLEEPGSVPLPGTEQSLSTPDPTPAARPDATSTSTPSLGASNPFQGTSLEDIGGDLGRLGSTSADVVNRFYEEAGPSRSWGDWMQQRSRAALGGDEGALGDLRGYLDATYQGPGGLDTERTGRLQQELQELYGATSRLGSGQDLAAFLRQSRPGLTPGMAEFEARRTAPELQRQGREFASMAQRQLSGLESERSRAEQFAAQRAEEESGIRAGAGEWLRGEQGSLVEALSREAEEKNKKAAELESLYGQAVESGDPWSLANSLGYENLGPWRSHDEKLREAQAAAEELWGSGQFREVKTIPLGELRLLPNGKVDLVFQLPGGRGEVSLEKLYRAKAKNSGWSRSQQTYFAAMLDKRQQEFERLFSPRSARTVSPEKLLDEGNARGYVTGWRGGPDVNRITQGGLADAGLYREAQRPGEPLGDRGLYALRKELEGLSGRGAYADVLPMYSSFYQLPYGLPSTITGEWQPFPGLPDVASSFQLNQSPEAAWQNQATPEQQQQLSLMAELLGQETPAFSSRSEPGLSVAMQDFLNQYEGGFDQFLRDLVAAETSMLYYQQT